MYVNYISYKLIAILGGAAFLLIPFSPILSFSISIFTLLTMSNYLFGYMRQSLIILAMLSIVIIIASREYTDEIEHDLSHYYIVYKALASGQLNELFGFAAGVEIGWPLLYLMVSKFNGNLSPITLAIINTSVCLFLLYVWINKHAFHNEYLNNSGVIAALIILFASVQTFGYLQRQAISTVILLFSISNTGKKSLVYLLLATLFHLTSLPLGILYLTLRKWHSRIKLHHMLMIFGILIFIKLNLFVILNYLSVVGTGIPGVNKLNYYLLYASEFSFTSKRFAILIFPLALAMILFWNKIPNDNWKLISIFSCLSYIVFLGIPLGPERLNFLLLFLYGYFVYLYLYKVLPNVTKYFILVYLFMFALEKMNFFGNYADPFWSRYPAFSFEPFYYLY
ncbi:EpsG family protein [Escherichia coli]|nr:EpsG family protein [Escherichia coli]